MPDDQSQGAQGGAGNGNIAGVGLGTPNEGAQGAQGAADQQGQGSQGASGDPWYKAHVKDADNLKAIETKRWDGVEAIVKSYRELDAAFSSRGAASQAPSKPDEYKLEVPAALKDGYSEAFAGNFRQWAHKAGLSQDAAAHIHNEFVKFAGEAMSAQQGASTEALTTSVTKAKDALVKAWGHESTPSFQRNLEMAKRAIAQLDPEMMQEMRDAGVIAKVGNEEMIVRPAIFKAMAKAGGQLFAEDTLYGAAASIANPFDPKTTNLDMQGKLFQTDPAKAELLIRSAGPEAMRTYEDFLSKRANRQ